MNTKIDDEMVEAECMLILIFSNNFDFLAILLVLAFDFCRNLKSALLPVR